MLTKCYDRDNTFIPAHYQPALLVDIALARGAKPYDLFRGVRLNLEQIKSAENVISPDQYLTLIANVQKLIGADDTSFAYGQVLFPGMYGPVSQALQQMSSCREVIEHFCSYHALLSPLLTPRIFENDKHLFVYWQDTTGAGEQLSFLIETSMKALTSMLDWFAGEKLPWQYQFNFKQPSYIEQYWVNFGDDISFDQQMNMLSIPKAVAEKPWSDMTSLGGEAVLNATRIQLVELGVEKSFLDQVYDYLMQNIDRPMNLDRISMAFKYSPASMKRKFKKHNTSFQEQVDLVRKHTAIQLFYTKGYSYQQVAEHLRFNDINNFRRAFKRWTGFSPSSLFAKLSA
jgi:AraC-like DNA-binding protein